MLFIILFYVILFYFISSFFFMFYTPLRGAEESNRAQTSLEDVSCSLQISIELPEKERKKER